MASSAAADAPVALVTAGSAGLGAAVAELFARNGMRVVVNYHANAARAAALVATLQAASTLPPRDGRVDYVAIKADLSVRADVDRLVNETMQLMCPPPPPPPHQQQQQHHHHHHQQLDVVFSNGGWTRMTNLLSLDEAMVDDDWDRCFTMNVKSHLWLMHAARPYLEASYTDATGAASFITTASLAGVKLMGSSLAYCVTKAAQLHLARGLALIAAPKIRVNSVSPGLLMTEWGASFGPDKIKAIRAQAKLNRIATVEDVAEQVMAFVRAKSVTGQNIVLDGGVGMPW